MKSLEPPPPGAGPEYKVKRDENDTGLIPVNMGRLRNRKDNSPLFWKDLSAFSFRRVGALCKLRRWIQEGHCILVEKGWEPNKSE